MLLGRVGEPDERLELLLAQRPPSEPVVRQAQQLPQFDGLGMHVAPGPQDLERLPLVPPVERPRPPRQRLLEPGPVADRLRPLRHRRPTRRATAAAPTLARPAP